MRGVSPPRSLLLCSTCSDLLCMFVFCVYTVKAFSSMKSAVYNCVINACILLWTGSKKSIHIHDQFYPSRLWGWGNLYIEMHTLPVLLCFSYSETETFLPFCNFLHIPFSSLDLFFIHFLWYMLLYKEIES